MGNAIPKYFKYWGKAGKDGNYHLLPYHCLDVSAVGKVLLEKNPFLLKQLSRLSTIEIAQLKPLLIFFLAIHDLGKYSESFQYIVLDLFIKLQGKGISYKFPYSKKTFCHGSIGFLLWKEYIFKKISNPYNSSCH